MSLFKKFLIIVGLLVLLLPLLIYFPSKGTGDMDIWLEWTAHIAMWGPINGYLFINARPDFWTVHPPIYFINLWLATKAAALFGVSWMMGIKIILLFYYLVTLASLIYLRTLFKQKSFWINVAVTSALFFGGLYFAFISMAYTTLDITFAPFIVFSLALLARRRYLLSGMSLAFAVLVKWINGMILPVFLLYFILEKKGYKIDKQALKFLAGVFLIFCLLIISFWLNHTSLLPIFQSLSKAFKHGSGFLAPGPLNFWWLFGYGFLRSFYPETYGTIIKNNLPIFSSISAVIFLLVSIAIMKSFFKIKRDISNLVQASLMINWSYYIWRTGVHENHLFIAVLLALSLAVIHTTKSNIRQYLLLCFFGLSPIFTHGFPVGNGFIQMFDGNFFYVVIGLLSALHIFVYLVYLRHYLRLGTQA